MFIIYRKRIVSEKGVPNIEHYLYEEHEMLQRAATECMCNMVMNEAVSHFVTKKTNKQKMLCFKLHIVINKRWWNEKIFLFYF